MPLSLPATIQQATLNKLAKLGIHNRFDLVLHLPLRYEDETQLLRIDDLQAGINSQVEGEIIHTEVAFRPRRSLIIPWWYRVITTLDMLFPVLVDWISYAFTKKNHQLN